MQVIAIKSERARVKKVKSLILSAGNQIGSVHFTKRSDNSKRRMCFRLHTQKPTYAMSPSGKKVQARKAKDSDNLQMTVFDVNKVLYKKGKMCGRGDWRSIPLENVERVCVQGQIYKIIA